VNIKKLIVGTLRTNCYVVSDTRSKEALIVDPGDDAEYIKRYISDKKLKPAFVVATHGHFDHVLSALDIKLAYNIPFLMHKKDEFLLKNMMSSAKYFTGIKSDPPAEVNIYLKDNDVVKIRNIKFKVIHTPGHTPGSISLYNKNHKVCFSGDLVFERGFGRCDFSYSDSTILRKSVEKIQSLPINTILYSGHGNKTNVDDIGNINL